MAHKPIPTRTVAITVSEKVHQQLEALAKEGGIKLVTLCGFLFDAAYAARVKACFDADLDAQVALVGLATISDRELGPIAEAAGLPTATAERMRDAWQTMLVERRRGL